MDNELNEHHGREPYYEDEIDLYQLIQVLLKRKKLIVSVFLAAVIVAIAASYIMKPVYRVSAVVGPIQFLSLKQLKMLLFGRKWTLIPRKHRSSLFPNHFHYEILMKIKY